MFGVFHFRCAWCSVSGLSAGARDDGYASAYDDSNYGCDVHRYRDGSSRCYGG